MPTFYKTLCQTTNLTQLALRLLILTGIRSNPLRHIHKDQIDNDIWTIPTEDMKGKRDATTEFRVPLSSETLKVIKQARCISKSDFIFSFSSRAPIPPMVMSKYMRKIGLKTCPHGFRPSLRDWLTETTNASPYEVAETILSHTVGKQVERAYRRTDYLEQRCVYMEKWAAYVTGQS
ncbi:phage integrase [Bartonella tribocorum]|nr:phage integrase [Bartonella tribocorum]